MALGPLLIVHSSYILDLFGGGQLYSIFGMVLVIQNQVVLRVLFAFELLSYFIADLPLHQTGGSAFPLLVVNFTGLA